MTIDWNPLLAAVAGKPEAWRYSVEVKRCGDLFSDVCVWFRDGDRSSRGIGRVSGPSDFVVAALTACVEKHEATEWRNEP